MPLLEVDGLAKSFGAIGAVRGVSFTLERGEILGIIGPNGSGKTTLFNMVLGQLRPDAGQVRFDGRTSRAPRRCPSPRQESAARFNRCRCSGR